MPEFHQPWWLALLVIPLVLLVRYIWTWKHSKGGTVRWSNQKAIQQVLVTPRAVGRHIAAASMLAVMCVSIWYIAQPTLDTTVPEERSTAMIAVDVSKSMDVEERLAQAKIALKTAVQNAPPDLNIGLVTFADHAKLVVAPTRDREKLVKAINKLKTQPGGTATGEGVLAANAALEQMAQFGGDSSTFNASITVVADGREEIAEGEQSLAEATKSSPYPVNGVAYGTEKLRYEGGCGTVCKPDYKAMQDAANTTGGTAYRASDGDALRSALEEVQRQTADVSKRLTTPREIAWKEGLFLFGLALAFWLAFCTKNRV